MTARPMLASGSQKAPYGVFLEVSGRKFCNSSLFDVPSLVGKSEGCAKFL